MFKEGKLVSFAYELSVAGTHTNSFLFPSCITSPVSFVPSLYVNPLGIGTPYFTSDIVSCHSSFTFDVFPITSLNHFFSSKFTFLLFNTKLPSTTDTLSLYFFVPGNSVTIVSPDKLTLDLSKLNGSSVYFFDIYIDNSSCIFDMSSLNVASFALDTGLFFVIVKITAAASIIITIIVTINTISDIPLL